MKKVAVIHTSPVSLNELKALFAEILPEVEMINIIDDSLLEEVKRITESRRESSPGCACMVRRRSRWAWI